MSNIPNLAQNMAAPFDTSKNYETGEFVVYDGLLYMFNTSHTAGAWNNDEVSKVTLADAMKGTVDSNGFKPLKLSMEPQASGLNGPNIDGKWFYTIMPYDGVVIFSGSASTLGAWIYLNNDIISSWSAGANKIKSGSCTFFAKKDSILKYYSQSSLELIIIPAVIDESTAQPNYEYRA